MTNSWGWLHLGGISAFRKTGMKEMLSLSYHVRTLQKVAVYKPERGLSLDTGSTGALTVDF